MQRSGKYFAAEHHETARGQELWRCDAAGIGGSGLESGERACGEYYEMNGLRRKRRTACKQSGNQSGGYPYPCVACAIIKQAEVSTCFPRTYTGFILQGLHHPGDLQAVEVPE